MRVKFSTADEFLQELYEERGQVEDGILRLTFLHQQDTKLGLDSLSVYAGVIVRGKIVELRQFIGQLWHTGNTEQDAQIRARAEMIRANIEAKARDLALEIRAGMFEA
jgi:hypothetical protein